jgi:TetR/AcrR family transcriptional regulator, cholesterol catabolism regulator
VSRKAAAATPTRSSARRDQILDTATSVFAEKGIIAATVRDISERAGILSGSLYHHFASKAEIIVDILAPVIRARVEEFDRIVERHKDPTEILRLVIAAEIAQSATEPRVARILRQDEHHISVFDGLDEVVAERRAIRARIESVLTNGITVGQFRADCNPGLTALALFDVTLGAYRHLKPIGRYGADDLTKPLTDLFLAGCLSEDAR